MLKKIFICDKCKCEWDIKNEKCPQMVCINLQVFFGKDSPVRSILSDPLEINNVWCRPCVISTGISEPASTEEKTIYPKKELSFEEKLKALISEHGFIDEGTA